MSFLLCSQRLSYIVLPHMARNKLSLYCLFQILNSGCFLDKRLTYGKHSINLVMLLLLLLNNGINVTECIEIALPSSVIKEKHLFKKIIRKKWPGIFWSVWENCYITQSCGGRRMLSIIRSQEKHSKFIARRAMKLRADQIGVCEKFICKIWEMIGLPYIKRVSLGLKGTPHPHFTVGWRKLYIHPLQPCPDLPQPLSNEMKRNIRNSGDLCFALLFQVI